ncbi:MAG: FkbM family methyltransferase [Novosphingobium sp.]|nr:FkbM family methyltransferase [Novosphingobium sp.]
MAKWQTLVARRSPAALTNFFARGAEAYLKAWWNEANWDMARNGEERVLSTVLGMAGAPDPVIVDVGLNHGEWTRHVLGRVPQAEIHGFEIVPQTFAHAAAEFGARANVHLNNIGLSSAPGEVEVTYYPGSDTGSSISGAPWDMASEVVTCAVDTFDAYAARAGLGKILLMKVDVEGHELEVLRGAARSLEQGLIETIQFEYGRHSIYSRTNLRDFYTLLGGLGYALGRIHPGFVHFKDYDFAADENFRSCNFLATRNPAVRDALRAA